MSKLFGLLFAVVILQVAPACQQVNIFLKHRSIEAYEVRPGILAMPRYTESGEVCEIGLERIRYSSEEVRRNDSLTREEIDQIVDELAPPNERGPKAKGLLGFDQIVQTGESYITFETYQNISVQIYGDASRNCNQGIVAAMIKWDKRKCGVPHT